VWFACEDNKKKVSPARVGITHLVKTQQRFINHLTAIALFGLYFRLNLKKLKR
jgi:hypothetical protein